MLSVGVLTQTISGLSKHYLFYMTCRNVWRQSTIIWCSGGLHFSKSYKINHVCSNRQSGRCPEIKTHPAHSSLCASSRSAVHIPSESIAMWQLNGRPNSGPEAKETEQNAFLLNKLYFLAVFHKILKIFQIFCIMKVNIRNERILPPWKCSIRNKTLW